jgi:hypothetical protein
MVIPKRIYVSRGFWVSFAILAALTIYGLVARLFFIDVLIGLLVILVGLHGLLYEYNQRLLISDRRKIRDNFEYITQWLDSSHSFLKSINTKHESRLHSLDVKRAQADEKLENTFRDAVKKIIELENKLNKTIRIVGDDTRHVTMMDRVLRIEKRIDKQLKALEKEKEEAIKRIVEISRRQRSVLRRVRKKGSITSREYRRIFRTKEKATLKEINEMISRGFLKRVGKGRATRYELGF